MSEWQSSSSQEDDNNQQAKFFTVFQNDFFLTNSLDIIDEWKTNIFNSIEQNQKINSMKYLQLQFSHLKKQQNLLLASYHIRCYSFCHFVNQAFKYYLELYEKIHQSQIIEQKTKKISVLDTQIVQLITYLQYVEQSRVSGYAEQIQQDIVQKNYAIIRQIFPLVLNEYTIWRLVMLIQSFRNQQRNHLLNVPFNMKLNYYEKCLKQFQSKSQIIREIHQKISKILQKKQYQKAFFEAVKMTYLKKQLKQQYRCDYLSCLRNIYYVSETQEQNHNLFKEYIFSTLKIPFYQLNKNLPTDYYQNLFLQIILKGKQSNQLFNLAIYTEPTVLQISKRKKLGEIEVQLYKMMKQVQTIKKQFLKTQKQVEIKNFPLYVNNLLDSQKFMVLVQLLAAIMENNRQVFTTALKTVYEIYINIANFLKQIYLSFGSQCWLCPQSIFSVLTLKTFRKISEDINADVKSVMYHMVDCLNKDNLPTKVIFEDNKFSVKKVSKLEYLSVIMFYMDDCSKEEQYLSLPQLAPINFQTSILLIKSLHMKLKHHEPNNAQMPLFTDYLRQCQMYKLKISFSWFKQNLKTNTDQRQSQFQIQVSLKIKKFQQIFRKCLNYRDRQFARRIIQQSHNNKHQITCGEIANFLKYNTGINNLPTVNGCNQFQAFNLLDEMKTMLSLKMDNLFSLQPYDQININYLHLLLTFYNDRIKEAKGSQIYAQLLQKIMKQYLQAPISVAQQFKEKYPKFFSDFIYKFHTLQIFYILNDVLSKKDKILSLNIEQKQKMVKKDMEQYQSAIQFIKNKISLVREQYSNNLQEIKQQLLQFIIAFASLLSENIPFQIFIEAAQFVVKILTKVPQLKNTIQLNFFFTEERLKNKNFIEQLISYFSKETYLAQHQRKAVISKYLILNIEKFMDSLQLKSFLKLIKLYIKINSVNLENWSFSLWEVLDKKFKNNQTKPNHFLVYFLLNVKQNYQKKDIMLSMFNQNQQQNDKNKNNYLQLLNFIEKADQKFWSQSKAQFSNIKIQDYRFIVDLIKEIKCDQNQLNKTVSLKTLWFQYISRIQNVDILFYYAAKLQSSQLIMKHPKIKQILTEFMLHSNFSIQLFHIFKIVLNQYKEFPSILQSIIKEYELQSIKILDQHFYTKLILINQKYPNPKIQKIILNWINSTDRKDPVKIHQLFYLNQIRSSLKQIPADLAQTIIFNIHKNPQQLLFLFQKVGRVFQKILFFPLKAYQNVDITKKQQAEEEQGWETDSQNEQKEDQKQQKIQKTQTLPQQKQKQQEQMMKENVDQNQNVQNSIDQQEDSQNQYCERPDILQMFYQEQNLAEFKQYKRFMILREQIDVYIKSDYKILQKMPIKDNQYLCNKVLQLQKILESFKQTYQRSIIDLMPVQLFLILKQMGYKLQRNEEQIKKQRKPNLKKAYIQRQRFSDRSESDYQTSSQQYDEDQNDDYQEDEDDQDQEQNYSDNQNSHQQQEINQDYQEAELPVLQPQLSKIQSEIKGTQLGRTELIQILDIYLIQLVTLPNSIFKQKHIVSKFCQVIQSKFGSTLFQSVLTVLRLEENERTNRKDYLQKIKKQGNYNNNYQLQELIGLAQIDKINAFQNVVSILKFISEKSKMQQIDPLNKQAVVLLPIAEQFFSEFKLPLQNNMMTFVFLYLQAKSKLQEFISNNLTIEVEVAGKIQKKYFKKICRLISAQISPHKVWQYLQNGLNYQIKFQDKLLNCLDVYSQQLYKKMKKMNQRIDQIFKMEMHAFNIISEEQKQISTLHQNQRLYYLLYNLISSYAKQIKQFYFANKHLLKSQFQADDQNDQNSIPKTIIKISNKIMTNQNFINLLQIVFRIIKTLEKHFFGRIQDKKFNRLIKLLRLVVQTATIYVQICQKQTNWKFQSAENVQLFLQSYSLGSYKFNRLIQVYNIIISFLHISSFCTAKFKKNILPYLIKNKQLALSVPLIFKVPSIEQQNINAQYIYLTRECSFDMAFYQVKSRAILVQFHQEEGSDHGGMIRQLMMGWKGYGVGEEHFFFGKLLGISFNQSVPYGGFIDLAMCIKITCFELTMQNLRQLDYQIYKGLKFIQQNDPADLDLTFQIQKFSQKSLQLQTYSLIQKGNEIKLTEQNKKEYIKLYLKKYYQVGRQQELNQVATGFYTVVNPQYAKIFKPNELLQHLKGKQVLDINILKKHVKYEEGYSEGSIIIKWFWEILETFNQQIMNKFIQFLTGSPKIPIFNLGFQVIIQRVFDVQNLPVAHTCFNTLDLPQYGSKQVLQKKLMQAIMQGNQNFGIL